MKKVLFVDDERQVLKAIRRIFAESDFQVSCAESAEAALEIMSKNAADIIVSDMRMPGMDGVELLKLIQKKYPDTIRIILSGYADENEIIETIKNNIAKEYMLKPWNNDELIRVIEQNLSEDNPRLPAKLITYINNLNGLPTTRGYFQKILSAIDENGDFEKIASEIEKDQTVSAKILHIVNSSFYGIKIGSVKKALSFLGINELHSLIMSVEIMDSLAVSGAEVRMAEKIWSHAYYTNKLHQMINRKFLLKESSQFEASAGLLYKIGIVLMLKYYGSEYTEILKSSLVKGGKYLYRNEGEAFGFTHHDISVYLLKWWNTPQQIIEAAGYYARPLDPAAENKELIWGIHISQHYASETLGINPFCEFTTDTFDMLSIDREKFEETYKKYILA